MQQQEKSKLETGTWKDEKKNGSESRSRNKKVKGRK